MVWGGLDIFDEMWYVECDSEPEPKPWFGPQARVRARSMLAFEQCLREPHGSTWHHLPCHISSG